MYISETLISIFRQKPVFERSKSSIYHITRVFRKRLKRSSFRKKSVWLVFDAGVLFRFEVLGGRISAFEILPSRHSKKICSSITIISRKQNFAFFMMPVEKLGSSQNTSYIVAGFHIFSHTPIVFRCHSKTYF